MEKEELKTLKEVYGNKANGQISVKDLKAEAVKWVKREIKFLPNNNKYAESILFKWMDFFNLTEEDLK